MNLGLLMLALLLVAGSIFGIILIAGQTQTVYTDSFGQVQSNETNATQGTITNTTAPLTGAGSGLALIFTLFLISVAAIVLIKFITKSHTGGRR